MVIKRVGPLSCAKIAGTLYAIIGLFAGAGISLVAMLGGFGGQTTESGLFGAAMGAAAIIVIPICYGVLGFLTSLIGAALYNVIAGLVGGVEVDTQ
jgi:hypothetical protein